MGIFGGRLRSTPNGRLRSTRTREIVFRKSPPASSQGKNLNVLRGDCITLLVGDRIQGSPCFFSRENFEGVEGRLRSTPFGRSHYTPYEIMDIGLIMKHHYPE
ncbi:hypothetical protein [Cylindrospermopsis curvispora]|uniref:Uncharacterized protein n=1 Tax=Cylindrospermopsis curvispora GIHE-G1 TaxID=2666332 RepID=A0A7H0EYM5_9CYAN|nr:hypothetical protein [Cylindrospermopsis curvispora]QNP28891.1 hypothetical protein IAR63_13600 [Cylindrospermopsis curvispora GIHE-G1]